jgi:lipoate-protein ligase A
MHGEYKVPRGKLVVVDVDRVGDALRNVRITGDFFLYPDDALGALSAGLEGAPVGASEETYRELVARAIPPGTEMVGFSPEAIAIAVVRAQQDATREGAADVR